MVRVRGGVSNNFWLNSVSLKKSLLLSLLVSFYFKNSSDVYKFYFCYFSSSISEFLVPSIKILEFSISSFWIPYIYGKIINRTMKQNNWSYVVILKIMVMNIIKMSKILYLKKKI